MTDLAYAPPSFETLDKRRVVFVDFITADYALLFDAAARRAHATSTITFAACDEGFAAICLKQPFISATLDGETVHFEDPKSTHGSMPFKILSRPVSSETHELIVHSCISQPVVDNFPPVIWSRTARRLMCKFAMSDMRPDACFLDAYLPSNLEFDHVKMRFSVSIKNSSIDHTVYSNGIVKNSQQAYWQIEYPDFFTSSCPWFHLGPSDSFESVMGKFPSSDRREIPICVYTWFKWLKRGVDLNEFLRHTQSHLTQLESDFGPFPHDSLTIYARMPGYGGMEYAGATASSLDALRHELDHSYFARSVTPANGNAGWMDEAIARWGDRCYPCWNEQHSSRANLGRRSPYSPNTHGESYDVGSDFLAYLDYKLREQGGLRTFLRQYARNKKYQTVNADEFQRMINEFHGKSLNHLFDFHVYSEDSAGQLMAKEHSIKTSPHLSFDDLIVDLDEENED